MKAMLEEEGVQFIGVVLEAETSEDEKRLNDLWKCEARYLVLDRNKVGLRLTIAPTPEWGYNR